MNEELYKKADEWIGNNLYNGQNQFFEYEFQNFLQENQLQETDFYENYLQSAIEHQDANRVDIAISLFSKKYLTKKSAELLKQLLLEDWHHDYENIVYIFENQKDKTALETLYKAFSLKAEALEYNDYYSFHYKLMWAIYKIEGKSCKERLSKLVSKVSPELRKKFQEFVSQIK